MGKKQKKGVKGEVSMYISRTRAVRKLQVTLADFRRLCILKGVYPREPKNKKKVNKGSTAPRTLYAAKDIAFLAHEPLLDKFRAYKVFARKLRTALGKKQISVAESLKQSQPTITLDHLIKERYPTFLDALRDLDDALCMLFLFERMPQVGRIAPAFIANISRLCAEFLNYVVTTHSLRKVFLSIKGIYYQAEIYGQQITWIMPYPFTLATPREVDFRVMRTFLDLYETLLGFVNFKLYTDEQLMYPPALDSGRDNAGAGLSALVLQYKDHNVSLAEALDISIASIAAPGAAASRESKRRLKTLNMARIASGEAAEGDSSDMPVDANDDDADDAEEFPPNEAVDEDAAVATEQQREDLGIFETLFKGKTVFLSREVPRDSLVFVITAFGGTVGWADAETSPFDETNEAITHQIVDRPTHSATSTTRDYVQPQWVYDCVNERRLLPAGPYAPGAKLPPHLSPFVEAKDGEYNPLDEQFLGTTEARAEGQEEEVEEETQADDGQEEEEEDDEEDKEEEEDDDDEEDDKDDEDDEEAQYAKEIAAEAAGVRFSEFSKKPKAAPAPSLATKKRARAKMEEEEERELAISMMKKKDRHLFRKIQHSNQQRDNQANLLKERKRALALASAAAGTDGAKSGERAKKKKKQDA